MNEIDELLKKLNSARKKAKKLREEMQVLRKAIIGAGGNPDPWTEKNIERNKAIYIKRQSGMSLAAIAREFNISSATVSTTCNRIEWLVLNKRGHYKHYKNIVRRYAKSEN
jgi:DNA invertase Pin-like site-specific DNA recombinase